MRKTLYAIIAVLLITITTLVIVDCDSDKVVTRGDLKNRVVTLPDSADARQAAIDAQAAAAQAKQTLKDIQDATAKLEKAKSDEPKPVYLDGSLAERTNPGSVIDVNEIWEQESNSYKGEAYIAFTFVEDKGFQKRFYPVCSDQVIQTGRPEIIMYHWKPNQNNSKHNEKGCFWIDGYLYHEG